jgi:hypothetical protein
MKKEVSKNKVIGAYICSMRIGKGSGLIVEVILRRPLFGTILTVFLPTSLLLILSQMVKVFSADHMEMVIEVNLTLLLVLTTM